MIHAQANLPNFLFDDLSFSSAGSQHTPVMMGPSEMGMGFSNASEEKVVAEGSQSSRSNAENIYSSLASIPKFKFIQQASQTQIASMEALNSKETSSSDNLVQGLTQQDQLNSEMEINKGKQLIVSEPAKPPSYVDITEYLTLPQNEAAKRLGVPTSTLSKRWKEAAVKRKWPYRTVCKLEKEITTLLHNISSGPLTPELEQTLAHLLKKRQEELRNVVIRM